MSNEAEAPVMIQRGLETNDPHELVGLMYPLFSGVKKFARDNKIDTTSGSWGLTLTWLEKK